MRKEKRAGSGKWKEKKRRMQNDSTGRWEAETQSGDARLYKDWL